jgi:hypothetical protein
MDYKASLPPIDQMRPADLEFNALAHTHPSGGAEKRKPGNRTPGLFIVS